MNAAPMKLTRTVLTRTVLALLLLLRSSAFAQTVTDPSLTVQPLVSGLSVPTGMAFIGTNDVLVLQKNDGRVRRVIAGVLQEGEVLDVAVDNASERGLLGIALHPQFPSTPFVYLYYTESSTGSDTSGSPTPSGNRVYRYTWNGSTLTSPNLILDLPVTPGPNHDGGVITFGPDGKLYVVIGDLNRDGQLQNFQSGPPPDDTGVIVRLNNDGTIPTDNPFFSQGGNVAKYYAYGIRNSFGLTFDPVTGKLWMTENGPDVYDEINLVEAGFNSGWERLMGPDERDPDGIGNLFAIPGAHYRDPSFSWLHTVAPTGLVFLDSSALGLQYLNSLFVGDINGGVLYRFQLNASRDGFQFQNPGLSDRVADSSSELSELVFGTGFGGITDIKVGPDGFLYVLSFSGRIFVISPGTPGLTWPAAPNNLVAQCSASGSQATLSWSSVNGATNYAVRVNSRSNDGPGCLDGWFCNDPPDKIVDNNNGITSYVANVTPGQAYDFWVHGLQGSNYGAAGATSFTCGVSIPTPTWPAAPNNLVAQCSASASQATLSWSSVNGATNYAVRVNSRSNDGPGCLDGWFCNDPPDKIVDDNGATSYLANITPGQAYDFWVHGLQGSNYGAAGGANFTCP